MSSTMLCRGEIIGLPAILVNPSSPCNWSHRLLKFTATSGTTLGCQCLVPVEDLFSIHVGSFGSVCLYKSIIVSRRESLRGAKNRNIFIWWSATEPRIYYLVEPEFFRGWKLSEFRGDARLSLITSLPGSIRPVTDGKWSGIPVTFLIV